MEQTKSHDDLLKEKKANTEAMLAGRRQILLLHDNLTIIRNEFDDIKKQHDDLLVVCKAIMRCKYEHTEDGYTKNGDVVTFQIDGAWINDLAKAIAPAEAN